MTRRILSPAVAAALLVHAGLGAAPAGGPLRPLEVLEQAERYLGRTVVLDIVEPLRGPATPEALARAEYGQVEVAIPEGHAGNLSLVPASFHLNDSSRYRGKFDRVLVSPLRVHGELQQDQEMSQSAKRPVYVFCVAAIEPLPPEPAVAVRGLAEIAADPAAWDRRTIAYEGAFRAGFEVSALDKEIWLSTDERTEVVNRPPGGTAHRVRATGVLFARPGARYGHLGAYRYQLAATRLEYLSP